MNSQLTTDTYGSAKQSKSKLKPTRKKTKSSDLSEMPTICPSDSDLRAVRLSEGRTDKAPILKQASEFFARTGLPPVGAESSADSAVVKPPDVTAHEAGAAAKG